jgi:peptidoglycan/LPS O-acetylase OafA/YrhL
MSDVPALDMVIAGSHSQAASAGTRFDVLDGMRGIAAISVMIYHFSKHENFSILSNAGIAVDLFFILSGFVIINSYGSRIGVSISAREYIFKRAIRLYPMFLIGLLIGIPVLYVVTNAGGSTYPNRHIIGSAVYNSAFLPYIGNWGINNFGAADPSVGEIFPANPPAWSLFFEVVASFSFVILSKLKRSALFKFMVLCYAAMILNGFLISFLSDRIGYDPAQGWGATNFIGGFPRVFFGFTLGMLLFVVANDTRAWFHSFSENYIRSSYLLYILLVAIFAFPLQIKGLYPMLVVATIAPCLVFFGSKMHCTNRVESNIARFLGWISYPLYCLHFPVGRAVFLAGGDFRAPRWVLVIISIVITFVVSVILTKLLEEPVRSYFSTKLLFGAGQRRARRAADPLPDLNRK